MFSSGGPQLALRHMHYIYLDIMNGGMTVNVMKVEESVLQGAIVSQISSLSHYYG